MRKIWITICALLASCFMLTGCFAFAGTSTSSQDTESSQETSSQDTQSSQESSSQEDSSSQGSAVALATPASLKMDSKGSLSWSAVENATSYEVTVGDARITTDKTKQDLMEIITSAGSYTVLVTAKNDTATSEAASYTLTAVKLPAPSKPVVETDPLTHEAKFVWTGGENTRAYLQKMNDGKWVSNSEASYAITSTGTYILSVKAKGYAAKDVLYLESDPSEASDPYEYQQGPVLSLDGMSLINWASEDGAEFDSYNLWINGEKAKEGIEKGELGYSLTEGEDPAITKTGEYNVQIEAVKDGNSYWSNMLEEVGTYNINPNEIYSFDNRIAKFPVIKEGVSVSNEQYHGESGYSLRFDAQHSEQLNLVAYVQPGHANDIAYLSIKKVSYWVYVEPIDGYEGNFPASDLPAVKWEKQWTSVNQEGQESQGYKGARFSATEDIPFGEWVKVEIDNVQMAYNGILILSYAKTLEPNYIIYIDDICFEELYEEVTVEDAEYSVEYSPAANYMGSWQSFDYTELDFGVENANKTLSVAMNVCGNADATLGNDKLGLFSVFVPDRDPVADEYKFIYMDAAKVSSLDTWNKVVLQLPTNAEGKCYITGMYNHSAEEDIASFHIFFKDVEVLDMTTVDGTAMPEGTQKTENPNGYYQSFVGLSTDLAVGTKVTVEMDVYVTGTFDVYSAIKWVDSVYSVDGGEVRNAPTLVDYNGMSAKAGEWIHLTFEAKVRDFDVLRLNPAYATMDVSAAGGAVFMLAESFKSGASFNYKNVEITEKVLDPEADGTAMPAGVEKTANPNGYYQSFVGLSTDLAAGTEVTVEMDVYITGAYDQYSKGIRWIDTVWTTEGGEVNAATTLVDPTMMDEKAGQWIHLTFDATVRDFDILRLNPEYAMMDVSAAGNAVFVAADSFKSEDSFNYKNVTIAAKEVEQPEDNSTAMPAGAQKTANANGYYQSFVGLSTDLVAGTAVVVEMDVYITGSYDQYSGGIKWVDTVYTTTGGEVNAATTLVDPTMMDANVGQWIHLTFDATVRDFDVLRLNPEYATMDVSAAGNAVFVAAASFKSAESFNYKNVTITAKEVEEPEEPDVPDEPVVDGTAMPAGAQKTANANGYYQSFVGLSTDLAAGTEVTVEMDVYITGAYDQYSKGIRWVDTVYTTTGGEVNAATTLVDPTMMDANVGQWIHLTFEATVRDFDVLRLNPEYATMDVSAAGNAVFVAAASFKSAGSFNYKNVTITAKEVEEPEEPEEPDVPDEPVVDGTAMPAGTQKAANPNGYYQSFVGLSTDLAAGTEVTVEMDVYITGSYDQYSGGIRWVDTVYTTTGGEVNAATTLVDPTMIDENVGQWIHLTFEATVRDFDVLRLNPDYATIDVSAAGTAVFLVADSFKSAESFNYKNVTITAKEVEEPEEPDVPDEPVVDGTAMPAGTQKTSNANGYYQSFVGLSTELAAGTEVTVEMDVYITGAYDQYSKGIRWIDTVWTTEGGEVNAATTLVDPTMMDEKAGQWIHLTFDATVRDFDVLRLNPEYAMMDVSAAGNAVFVAAASFKSAESFNYKNVTITAKEVEEPEEPDVPDEPDEPAIDGTAMPAGTQKTSNANGYYQAAVGLSTDLVAGTAVVVEMDVYITGSYDQYSGGIKWVDTVWTTSGGEVNVANTLVNPAKMDENVGQWIHLTFEATVRDFDVLRLNTSYAMVDVSAAGTAVFLIAESFKSEESFNYKNVVITAKEVEEPEEPDVPDEPVVDGTAMPAGTQKTANANGYYQSFVGLSTDLAAGTEVTVEMDVYITGSYDQYSGGIRWVDTVYTTEGGKVNAATTLVNPAMMDENVGQWIHLTFNATVRDFDVLRLNPEYATMDVSAAGNAVFVAAASFKSAESFNYKNVTITAKEVEQPEDNGTAMPAGTQKTSNANGYYQSFVGLSTDLAAGTEVTVEMDVYITGSYDQYSKGIRWIDTVWTTEGGEVNAATTLVDPTMMDENVGQWIHLTFNATVRDFDVLRLDTSYATMDVSSAGNAVFVAADSFKSAESFNYKNVTITAA